MPTVSEDNLDQKNYFVYVQD